MYSFYFAGEKYRSLSDACRKLRISYQKVKRLMRHYERARNAPTTALAWVVGAEDFNPREEAKTEYFEQDRYACKLRKRKHERHCRNVILATF